MAPRTLVTMVAVLTAGCFVDQPGDTPGSTGGTTGATTTGEPGTSGATTSGATTTAPETTVEPTSGSTTGSTTGSTDPTTTTVTTDPTLGSTCPAADGFPKIDPPECRACLSASCCDPISECAAVPACSGAWSCQQDQQCYADWASCPGYADHKGKLDAISACGAAACGDVCTIGPCPAEQTACEQNPECQAVDECVRTNCMDPCPAEDPECILPCWGMCQEQHPEGAKPWDALLQCLGSKCP